MVKYDSLVKLEKEISDLRSKIRRLESEKSMHESNRSSAQTRSNIGLTTMPINMSLGLSMKIMADGDVRNIESKISSLSSQISSSKSELRRLEHEFDEMVKTWKAERKEAQLIVDHDKLYIKGDNSKMDILANAKKYRLEVKTKLNELVNNPRVKEFISSKEELQQVLSKSDFETSKVYRTSSSKLSDKVYMIRNATGLDAVEETLGYMLPDSEFPRTARRILESKIRERENEIEKQKQSYENLQPRFLDKILKSRFEAKRNQIKISADYKIAKLKAEIENYKNVEMVVDDLEKSLVEPFNLTVKDALYRYKRAESDLEYHHESRMISRIEKLKEDLSTYSCLSKFGSVLSSEVQKYLLDNNLSLSTETLRNAVKNMSELDPEIKAELKPFIEKKTTYSYEPQINRSRY